ncbi:Uncharacterized protein BP5553_04939 [Venustampulla echinocandica]|uniref:Rhodopsin domain-containing protein n=1 Tax=Venustampulla echinocandica TaxID=2656787 RepID=A0A370TPQ2_9HELO|nr:Uncharacterized protein BP5553_04939 [Venustampulla echinocandica]RDL37506.1 Uncharacterized protein BP5553_04939 [Venustampulla echinocandica]
MLLYKRVVAGSSRPAFIYIVNGAIVAQVIYGITFVLLMVLQCRPISAYWLQYSYPTPYTEKFSCLYEGTVPMANACVSVVTDFLAAMLPMFLFMQLKMPRRDKFGLGAIFGVGFMSVASIPPASPLLFARLTGWWSTHSVCITGIVRSVLVRRIFYQSYDVTWLSHDLWSWTYVETNLLVICTAIPPLRVYFKRILGGTTSGHSGGTPDRNTFHRRRPSEYSDLPGNSHLGTSTDSIALHDVESGKIQPVEYQVQVPRRADLGDGGDGKPPEPQRFNQVYLDKELPSIAKGIRLGKKG